MLVIAVTGGLGSGKSTAAEYFRSRGAIVLSLDDIAHQAIAPGMPAYDRIVEAFGDDVVGADGAIDRPALAARAFDSDEDAALLNRLVHPSVLREVVEGITNLRLMERPPAVVVLEIPLLAEAPVFADVVDMVLALHAPESVRIERAVAAGMSEPDVRRRISHQASDAQRAAFADRVISNDAQLDEFLGKLEQYWDEVALRGS
jgi:dephospho-CoA kinase